MNNLNIKYLEWDSDFLGFKVGSVELLSAEDIDVFERKCAAKTLDYQLIYMRTPILLENLIDRQAIDCKVIFRYIMKVDEPAEIHPKISSYPDGEVSEKLMELGYTSGEYSRFKLDETFDKNVFKLLYSKWVINSVNRQIADDVLVYKEDDKIAGFITYKNKGGILVIGLIAVMNSFQGKGIGGALLRQVKAIAKENYCYAIDVATQKANQQAMNFYLKNDFVLISMQNIYHVWL